MNHFILLAILIGLMIFGSIIIKRDRNKTIKERKEDKAAWVAVDKDGQEVLILSNSKPHRMPTGWWTPYDEDSILEFDLIYVDDGFIEKHLGRTLTWENEPAKLPN